MELMLHHCNSPWLGPLVVTNVLQFCVLVPGFFLESFDKLKHQWLGQEKVIEVPVVPF
jgi:hypothetical protein